MILEKMKLSKKPFTRRWSLRKKVKYWYVLPQRWTWRKSVAEISYNGNLDAYTHKHFWLICRYQFSWLFIDLVWELDTSERLSETIVRHEPLKYDHEFKS